MDFDFSIYVKAKDIRVQVEVDKRNSGFEIRCNVAVN